MFLVNWLFKQNSFLPDEFRTQMVMVNAVVKYNPCLLKGKEKPIDENGTN
jgi:hypothetical protein